MQRGNNRTRQGGVSVEEHPSGLRTMPNEHPEVPMRLENVVQLPRCCPVSHNPQPGSTLTIRYRAGGRVLEVYALKQYVKTYIDGHPDGTRNMEAMVQRIAQDCAAALGVVVFVHAHLFLVPEQEMRILVTGSPDGVFSRHSHGRLVGAEPLPVVPVAPNARAKKAPAKGRRSVGAG